MRLYLINPHSGLGDIIYNKKTYWSKYRIWKPLGLLTVAGLTPPDWEISVFDENLEIPDYSRLAVPDLVGITAFTSQASRAYAISGEFRKKGVPVVMGGIHVTLCPEEALRFSDSIVLGEAEGIWSIVLDDLIQGRLQRKYISPRMSMEFVKPARHDLLASGYALGMIQTSRGCPFQCSYCSVRSFNGMEYRIRPVSDVIEELKLIKENYVLFVDDNLIGVNKSHISRAKYLFREMIGAGIKKKWIAQTSINFGEDTELVELASRAGCIGIFIGLETVTEKGLEEVRKKINLQKYDRIRALIKNIQKFRIPVTGSFMMGLDADQKGIGKKIADYAIHLGLDLINAFIITPFPGTELYKTMNDNDRILLNNYPDNWKYYSLNYPVIKLKNFTAVDILKENEECFRIFFSNGQILSRIIRAIYKYHARHQLQAVTAANISYRWATMHFSNRYREFGFARNP